MAVSIFFPLEFDISEPNSAFLVDCLPKSASTPLVDATIVFDILS